MSSLEELEEKVSAARQRVNLLRSQNVIGEASRMRLELDLENAERRFFQAREELRAVILAERALGGDCPTTPSENGDGS